MKYMLLIVPFLFVCVVDVSAAQAAQQLKKQAEKFLIVQNMIEQSVCFPILSWDGVRCLAGRLIAYRTNIGDLSDGYRLLNGSRMRYGLVSKDAFVWTDQEGNDEMGYDLTQLISVQSSALSCQALTDGVINHWSNDNSTKKIKKSFLIVRQATAFEKNQIINALRVKQVRFSDQSVWDGSDESLAQCIQDYDLNT